VQALNYLSSFLMLASHVDCQHIFLFIAVLLFLLIGTQNGINNALVKVFPYANGTWLWKYNLLFWKHLINPFNDPYVIPGQGTVGLEILK
jgi:hypothetical protein